MSDNNPSSLTSTDGFRTPDGRRTFLPQSAWGWCEVIVVVLLGLYLLTFYFCQMVPVHAGRKALESTLRANLHQIRQAITEFNADTGCNPAALTDMVLPQNVAPKYGVNADGKRVPLPAGKYQGPYLQVSNGIGGVPVNPFNKPTESEVSNHWTYRNGIVHPAGPVGKTLDGIPYSEL